MNDRCTPATARRLKELGFKQPEAAFGQVWYDAEGNPFLIGNLDSPMWLADAYVYAATAPDILRELGDWHSITVSKDRKTWCCDFLECTAVITPFHKVTLLAFHDNPAEACAEAWEAKQKS